MTSFYMCALITAASAFTSLGFSIQAALVNTKLQSALYATARSLAVASVCLIPFFYHSTEFLTSIAIIMIIVQALDAIIGFKAKNTLKSYGPMVTSILNLFALIWLLY